MENLNYFDVIVYSLVLLLGLKGLFNGFIKEFFGLFGIVGGVFVASRYSNEVGEIIGKIFNITNSATLSLIGFIAAIAIFWVLVYFLGIILKKVLILSGLGVFDKVFGFIAGGGKIFLIFAIIVYAISNVSMIKKALPEVVTSSSIYPYLSATGEVIIKIDPVNVVTNNMVENLDESVNATVTKAVESSIEQIKESLNKDGEL